MRGGFSQVVVPGRGCAGGSLARAARSLESVGWARLPLFPAAEAGVMLRLWWDTQALRGVRYADADTWSTRRGAGKHLYGPPCAALQASVEFARLRQTVDAAAQGMFGPGWRCTGKSVVFANCPNRSRQWALPSGWHTDIDVPARSAAQWPLFVYAFAFLDVLQAHGGATLLLTRSALRGKLMREPVMQGSPKLCEALAAEQPGFAALFGAESTRVIPPAALEQRTAEGLVSVGVRMRVVELLGEPGDVVFWDPRCLHSASANAGPRPRTVVRFRLQNIPAVSAGPTGAELARSAEADGGSSA